VTALVWLREDLRLDDNRALAAAVARARAGDGVVHACWCATPRQWDAHGMGDNRRWFLCGSVRELAGDLAAQGIALHVLPAGDFAGAVTEVLQLALRIEALSIDINDEYPLNEQRRDARLAEACAAHGIALHRHQDGVLVAPTAVQTKSGSAYTVFTPWKKAWLAALESGDSAPRNFRAPAGRPGDTELAEVLAASLRRLDALERPLVVPAGVRAAWQPGAQAARARLQQFARRGLAEYAARRDLPALPGTSALSPYLAAGCLSPRRALDAARKTNGGSLADGPAATWINELAWRDFYRQVVFHHPHVSRGHAFRRDTDRIRWRRDANDLAAWQEGRTGVPLVDAAMRQLLATGWMHNRLRMVTAMYLSKDLLLDWRLGEAFFARHLVDWDFAANNGGWQWSASTGTDAAPYFRLFNPVRQGERFDPDGAFVRHWLPELRDVPDRHVQAPWRADADLFGGIGFPPPRIDHARAKERVLAAFRAVAPAMEEEA
jgi:deoxyribodipyrimidine photo-lyase